MPRPMAGAPAFIARSGDVEEWEVENWTNEIHAFHIHQIHFLVMAMDGYIVFHHVAPRRSCDDATVELLCDLFLGSSRGRMKSPAFSGRSRSRS